MSFTGKATYSAGASLPEIAEDVSDIISIVSPYETPLLDLLGDSTRCAHSTYHEWIEDRLTPNTDTIDDAGVESNPDKTDIRVSNADRFRVGDLVKAGDWEEVMLVQAINLANRVVTFRRFYGGTPTAELENGMELKIISNPNFEGSDCSDSRFTNRVRLGNWTQIFSAGIKVSGSEMAVRNLAVADELDYQKQERLRELLRDLENTIINGTCADTDKQGTSIVRRSMNGLIKSITTNAKAPSDLISGTTDYTLTEELLNLALRNIWKKSSSRIDTIVCNGTQKRKINSFITSSRAYNPADETFRDMVSTYESDFGVCKVILSRYVPEDTILLLDSSRIDVMPLAGRSFHYKQLASTGDYEAGEIIGEYTMEFRNESAHGMITQLTY